MINAADLFNPLISVPDGRLAGTTAALRPAASTGQSLEYNPQSHTHIDRSTFHFKNAENQHVRDDCHQV